MRIGVFTLAYRDVSFPTFCGMVGLATLARGPLRKGDPDFPAMGVSFEFFFRRGFSAPHNAAKLMDVALGWPRPIDSFLFIESDVAFFPVHVERILETHRDLESGFHGLAPKSPIVGAVYPASGERAKVVGGREPQGDPPPRCDVTKAVAYLGFGFVLVPAQLFLEHGKPYFPESVGDVYEGPDVLLCRWAREHGYPLYADLGLDVGHMYAEPRTLEDLA